MMAGSFSQGFDNLIYLTPIDDNPSRYELIRYSTWRIYFYQELQSCRQQQLSKFTKLGILGALPNFSKTIEETKFYHDMFSRHRQDPLTARQDSISHYICRMLYCLKQQNHSKFIQMEKNILRIKLDVRSKLCTSQQDKIEHMSLLKRIVSSLTNTDYQQLDVPQDVFSVYSTKIDYSSTGNPYSYARVVIEMGESAIRSKRCFIQHGYVYIDVMQMHELVLMVYGTYLMSKLTAIVHPVLQLMSEDVDDQISSFLRQTLDALNRSNFDESTINRQFKLSLKNVESVWKRYYPPCMMHLTHKLKIHSHLKHQGRRQLWLFLKACGMEMRDNQQYFRMHFQNKMKDSALKGHIYNIAHAYGKEGKKVQEKPKLCRNIITAPAPKRDEYHGCPFAHWRKDDLVQMLKSNYSLTEKAIEEIVSESEEKHFQVACGRLFEAVNLPAPNNKEPKPTLPLEISKLLAKSPHQYFYAGVEMTNYKKNGGKIVNKKTGKEESNLEF